MVKDKRSTLILILIGIIVVLITILAYAFLIKPSLDGLVIQGYYQGIGDIISQVNTNGYVQIPLSENQSVILVPYQPQVGDNLSG